MLDNAGGNYKGTFEAMMAIGIVLGAAGLFIGDDKAFLVWFSGWFGGLLLGVGFGLWLRDG